MRYTIVRPLVLAAVLVSFVPAPAHAAMGAGFWRWWDSLSGPGPFQGVALQADVACYGTNDYSTDKAIGWVSIFNCFKVERELHITVGTEIGRLHGRNNLDPNGTSVLAVPVFATAKVGNRYIDAGVDLGFIHFGAENGGTNVFALGPRVALRPLALSSSRFSKSRRARALEIRAFTTRIPGTLTASDFGVPQSSWTGGHEWLNNGLTITIDVLSAFGR